MKAAMGALAFLAIVGGVLQIPKVTEILHDFLHPAFEDSRYFEELEPSGALTWIGLLVGAALSIGGIALAYALYVRDADRARVGALRTRFAGLHRFFANKWY